MREIIAYLYVTAILPKIKKTMWKKDMFDYVEFLQGRSPFPVRNIFYQNQMPVKSNTHVSKVPLAVIDGYFNSIRVSTWQDDGLFVESIFKALLI